MKILAIDDEKLILQHYERLLTNNGHEIITALDVSKGVEEFMKAHEEEKPFDIILLDIIMTDYNGSIALQHFRELEKEYELKETSVVVISGQENLGDVILLKDLKIKNYIIKSTTSDERILKALK